MRFALLILVCTLCVVGVLGLRKVNMQDTIHWTDLKTGDLLLFSHEHYPFPLTHVAMVYIDPINGQYLVFESIHLGDYNLEPHTDGVVLSPLKTRLENYGGLFMVRQLNPEKRTVEFLRKFDEKVKENLGRPFNNSSLSVTIKRWLEGFPTLGGCVFCSELIADVIVQTDLVEEIPNRYKLPMFMASYSEFVKLPFGVEKRIIV
jgi:hypothetical protein